MKKLINIFFARGILSIISLFLVSSIIMLMTGCKDDDKLTARTAIMTIEPQTVLNGTVPESGQLVECMVGTEQNSNVKHYLYLGRIEGFEYVKGFEYRVKVLISPIDNPPMDGHSESFKLVELLSKVKVDE